MAVACLTISVFVGSRSLKEILLNTMHRIMVRARNIFTWINCCCLFNYICPRRFAIIKGGFAEYQALDNGKGSILFHLYLLMVVACLTISVVVGSRSLK